MRACACASQRSDGFVVQTGDARVEGKSDKNGYVPPGKSDVRLVPLEVYVKGDKEPIYSTTFDDDGRGGYAAALPFNAYGALGMAREEYNVDSASSQVLAPRTSRLPCSPLASRLPC